MIGVHDFAHRTNLAVEAVVKKLKNMCKNLHLYFLASPKRHLEVVETEGLKILNKVHTRWIFLLEPLKHILGEYKMLIVKFVQDAYQESTANKNLSLLYDVSILLAFPWILPLLESINSLIKFVQVGNVFVFDMIVAVKICQVEIYMMYCNSANSFQPIHFQLFSVVADHSHTIS
jgi:hypothetical protein